jgi:hypothetical protein
VSAVLAACLGSRKFLCRVNLRTGLGQKNEKMRVVSGDIIRLEQQLSDTLGAAVTLKMGKKNQGKMVVEFGNLDVLDGIIAKISSPE